MSFSFTQTKDLAGSVGTPHTLNFNTAVSVGNSIIVWIGDYNTSGAVISAAEPTYNGGAVVGATKLIEVQNSASGTSNIVYFAVWLLPNVQSSGTSIQVATTNAIGDGNSHIYIAEVAGLGASPSIDAASPNPATNSSPAGGALSSGATGNAVGSSGIVLGGMMQDGISTGWTPPAGWTTITPLSYAGASYQEFVSSGSSYDWSSSGTGAGQWAAGAVILKVANGVSGTGTASLKKMTATGTGNSGVPADIVGHLSTSSNQTSALTTSGNPTSALTISGNQNTKLTVNGGT